MKLFSKPAIVEVTEALEAAPLTPDLVVVPKRKWRRLYRSLDAAVRAHYEAKGLAKIARRKNGLPYNPETMRPVPTVEAVYIKGVPVAPREDYEELMQGRRSSRIVLAV